MDRRAWWATDHGDMTNTQQDTGKFLHKQDLRSMDTSVLGFAFTHAVFPMVTHMNCLCKIRKRGINWVAPFVPTALILYESGLVHQISAACVHFSVYTKNGKLCLSCSTCISSIQSPFLPHPHLNSFSLHHFNTTYRFETFVFHLGHSHVPNL